MNIQNNPFFQSSKQIKPYNCSMIATDGPSIVDKVDLGGLVMTYDDVNASTMKLTANRSNIPLLMQEDCTFLLIYVDYYGTLYNPQCQVEENNYLEYYFDKEPFVLRPIGQYMVLTGNVNHKIPKVYLNNPQDRDIWINIMSANILSGSGDTASIRRYENLYYNSITSDHILSGSTEFNILDTDGAVILILPYDNIATYNKTDNNIEIFTNSNETIILGFLSEFNAFQAQSRMSWVMQDELNRYLTVASPSVDVTSPVITWANTGTTFQTDVLTLDDIRTYYLSAVTDNRDGMISIYNVNIIIFEVNQNALLTGITHDGNYTIIFEVKDVADNKTTASYDIKVSNELPVINFTVPASGSGFTMNLSGTITKDNIRTYSIDSVTDLIDVLIPISAVTVDIVSGVTTYSNITIPGTYNLTYSVTDSVGNSATTSKVLTVPDTVAPVITYNFPLISGNTFTLADYGGNLLNIDLINYYISAVTDLADGNIPLSNVDVLVDTVPSTSPSQPYIITGTGSYDIIFSVSDAAGNIDTETVITISVV